MSKTMFTPGPWEVASDFIGPLHVRPVGQPWSVAHVGHEDFDICEANARLIAAAPDLYEALNAVFHAKIIYVGGGPEESIAECGIGGDMEILRQMVSAALAKAHPILSPQAEAETVSSREDKQP